MSDSTRRINPLNRFIKSSAIVHILYHAKKKPFYGSWLKEELMRHGLSISDGTLYPWLNRLAYSGYLLLDEKKVEGKIRKYYSITERGEETLLKIKEYLNELIHEVLERK